jgi:hypothetical protein
MTIKLFIKPLIFTIAALAIGIYYMFPESFISDGINHSASVISVLIKHLGVGLLFSCLSFFPTAIFAGVGFLLLLITGKSLYRWSLGENSHLLLRTAFLYRNFAHGIIFLFLMVVYSAFVRTFETTDIIFIRNCFILLFLFVELFYLMFTWSFARKAISLAKESLPFNTGFVINTTKDACWIYSCRGNKTFRTTLSSNGDGSWKEANSYSTSEHTDDW